MTDARAFNPRDAVNVKELCGRGALNKAKQHWEGTVDTKLFRPYSFCVCWSRAVVLNLGAMTLLKVKHVFHRGHVRPSENTDMCIIIHNSRKITVMRKQQK